MQVMTKMLDRVEMRASPARAMPISRGFGEANTNLKRMVGSPWHLVVDLHLRSVPRPSCRLSRLMAAFLNCASGFPRMLKQLLSVTWRVDQARLLVPSPAAKLLGPRLV